MNLKKIQLQYFASIRQQTKISSESIQTHSQNAMDLWIDLKNKYNIKLDDNLIRVAINDEYRPLDTIICDNDSIVFIPPVAGG